MVGGVICMPAIGEEGVGGREGCFGRNTIVIRKKLVKGVWRCEMIHLQSSWVTGVRGRGEAQRKP